MATATRTRHWNLGELCALGPLDLPDPRLDYPLGREELAVLDAAIRGNHGVFPSTVADLVADDLGHPVPTAVVVARLAELAGLPCDPDDLPDGEDDLDAPSGPEIERRAEAIRANWPAERLASRWAVPGWAAVRCGPRVCRVVRRRAGGR
jgi:hypothetical protein